MKRIIVKLNDWVIAKDAVVADTFFSRARGLMFRKDLSNFDGMLIAPCNSIHTVGMLFTIDVVFLNKKFEVVKIIENLKPYRLTRPYFRAFQVLELAAGTLKERLQVGDQLEITHV